MDDKWNNLKTEMLRGSKIRAEETENLANCVQVTFPMNPAQKIE